MKRRGENRVHFIESTDAWGAKVTFTEHTSGSDTLTFCVGARSPSILANNFIQCCVLVPVRVPLGMKRWCSVGTPARNACRSLRLRPIAQDMGVSHLRLHTVIDTLLRSFQAWLRRSPVVFVLITSVFAVSASCALRGDQNRTLDATVKIYVCNRFTVSSSLPQNTGSRPLSTACPMARQASHPRNNKHVQQ